MIIEKMRTLISDLREAGINATENPPWLNPPCAWVCARRIEEFLLCGGNTVVFDVYLISRAIEIPNALSDLSELLEKALSALGDYDIESVTLDETVTLPQGGGPMPAFKITVSI